MVAGTGQQGRGMGFVYFIHATALALIKIGCTRHPIGRLREMQTGSPVSLDLMGVIPGTFHDEGKLHRRFEHLRERGEWFRAEADLLDFIAAEARTWHEIQIDMEPTDDQIRGMFAWARRQAVTLHGETRTIAEWVREHQLDIREVVRMLRMGRSPLAALRPPAWMIACGRVAGDSRRLPEYEEPADFEIPYF